MAEHISIGDGPDEVELAPWQVVPSEPGEATTVNLGEAAAALLEQARQDARGKASAAVLMGAHQRAVLVGLVAGSGLAEHASPKAASLQVLSGRFRLHSGEGEWLLGQGDLVAIPPERHAVDCLEDGAFLLTVSL